MANNMVLPPHPSACYGVWKKDGEGDVHVYVSNVFGVVIGKNKTHKPDLKFSDPALSVTPDGRIELQYADESGDARHAAVSDEIWKDAISRLLSELRSRVQQADVVK